MDEILTVTTQHYILDLLTIVAAKNMDQEKNIVKINMYTPEMMLTL